MLECLGGKKPQNFQLRLTRSVGSTFLIVQPQPGMEKQPVSSFILVTFSCMGVFFSGSGTCVWLLRKQKYEMSFLMILVKFYVF